MLCNSLLPCPNPYYLTDVALDVFMEFGYPSQFFCFEKGEYVEHEDFAGDTFKMRLW